MYIHLYSNIIYSVFILSKIVAFYLKKKKIRVTELDHKIQNQTGNRPLTTRKTNCQSNPIGTTSRVGFV